MTFVKLLLCISTALGTGVTKIEKINVLEELTLIGGDSTQMQI